MNLVISTKNKDRWGEVTKIYVITLEHVVEDCNLNYFSQMEIDQGFGNKRSRFACQIPGQWAGGKNG